MKANSKTVYRRETVFLIFQMEIGMKEVLKTAYFTAKALVLSQMEKNIPVISNMTYHTEKVHKNLFREIYTLAILKMV